jgi:hypothetical protein
MTKQRNPMKNIHLISTDKPSRLFYDISIDKLVLAPTAEVSKWFDNKHIYITSDETLPYDSSIFDNGAFHHRDAAGDVYIITKHTFKPNPNFCKRIILTTDLDLIADGVQAIDEKFLEWFVRNPACEKIEVQKTMRCTNCGQEYCDNLQCRDHKDVSHYKIIIPQEQPKQETLEEAAKEFVLSHDFSLLTNQKHLANRCFQYGAKWQAERMYSEEEVLKLIQSALLWKDDGKIGSLVTAQSGTNELRMANFYHWWEENKNITKRTICQ